MNIEKVILFQIEKTSKTAKQYSQREFDRLGLGITVDQWVLLKIIEEQQPLSQTQLADASIRDAASITRSLDILERKSFIERRTIAGNRRQFDIVLTVQGSDFVQRNMDMVTRHRQKSTQGLSEQEIGELFRMLAKIQQNMQ